MTSLYFLRAMGDLGLYYCAAGTFAALFGGELALELLLLQSACYALSSALQGNQAARLAALVPALLLYVFPVAPADMVCAAPALAYLIYLAWTGNYQLSRYRQADVFNAVRNVALKMVLGLACDPVAGLVEVPCIKRNVMGAMNAIAAADMALAGIRSQIPVDEVIDAMGEVGRRLPVELRETALGGLAATPTGKAVKKRLRQITGVKS